MTTALADLRAIYTTTRDLLNEHRKNTRVSDELIALLYDTHQKAKAEWNAAVLAQTSRSKDALYALLTEHLPVAAAAEVAADVLQAVAFGCDDIEDAADDALGRYSIDVPYPADLPERVAALLTESEAA